MGATSIASHVQEDVPNLTPGTVLTDCGGEEAEKGDEEQLPIGDGSSGEEAEEDLTTPIGAAVILTPGAKANLERHRALEAEKRHAVRGKAGHRWQRRYAHLKWGGS